MKEFEKGLYAFMDTQYPQVEKAIRETGEISEETKKLLKEGIELFRKDLKKELGIGQTIHGEAE